MVVSIVLAETQIGLTNRPCHAVGMTHPIWPLFDLRVRTPRLELRYVDDTLAVELARLAVAGIHDPDFMPFRWPWSIAESPALEQSLMRRYWRDRASLGPAKWALPMAVIADGQVVGITALKTEEYPVLREFETGSWLGRGFQGAGIGREMREASLHLGFAGLGADFATTAAWHDNGPSLGVTRRLGYTEIGPRRMDRMGMAADMVGFRLPRSDWSLRLRRDDITIDGLEPCLELLGLAGAAAD